MPTFQAQSCRASWNAAEANFRIADKSPGAVGKRYAVREDLSGEVHMSATGVSRQSDSSSLRRIRLSEDDFFGIIEEMPKTHYLGEFELLVMLAVIRLGEGAYGVPISREIEQHTRRDVAFGTVYATLEAREGLGLLEAG